MIQRKLPGNPGLLTCYFRWGLTWNDMTMPRCKYITNHTSYSDALIIDEILTP